MRNILAQQSMTAWTERDCRKNREWATVCRFRKVFRYKMGIFRSFIILRSVSRKTLVQHHSQRNIDRLREADNGTRYCHRRLIWTGFGILRNILRFISLLFSLLVIIFQLNIIFQNDNAVRMVFYMTGYYFEWLSITKDQCYIRCLHLHLCALCLVICHNFRCGPYCDSICIGCSVDASTSFSFSFAWFGIFLQNMLH